MKIHQVQNFFIQIYLRKCFLKCEMKESLILSEDFIILIFCLVIIELEESLIRVFF